jgi:hypothetical protein
MDCLHPADLPADQPDFDAVGVVGRFCQDVFDNTPGQLAGALIRFQHDINFKAWLYVRPVFTVHQIRSLFAASITFFAEPRKRHGRLYTFSRCMNNRPRKLHKLMPKAS